MGKTEILYEKIPTVQVEKFCTKMRDQNCIKVRKSVNSSETLDRYTGM